MPKSRSKKPAARRGRPRVMGPVSVTPPTSEQSLQPSLPPAAPETALVSSPKPEDATPSWYCPPDSKVRTVALQIIAMRIAGMEDAEIAKALDISEKSISPYVYRAGKNGWLDLDNPKERMQFQVVHKAVRNIDAALDNNDSVLASGMKVKDAVALKVAEMTIGKQFDQQQTGPTAQTIVAIRIEMPPGAPQSMREDTTGGLPAYVDAD